MPKIQQAFEGSDPAKSLDENLRGSTDSYPTKRRQGHIPRKRLHRGGSSKTWSWQAWEAAMATAGAVKMRKADVGTPLTSGTAVAKSFSTSFLTRSLGGSGSAVYKHSIRRPNIPYLMRTVGHVPVPSCRNIAMVSEPGIKRNQNHHEPSKVKLNHLQDFNDRSNRPPCCPFQNSKNPTCKSLRLTLRRCQCHNHLPPFLCSEA